MTDTTAPVTDSNTAAAGAQTLGFQAEVKQLLQLMIHSLYSHPEIFLRELISNASDACDKLRFEALDKPALWEGDSELAVRIDWDEAARTVTVADNGIGLSREEAIANLGTIARSGTREFLSRLGEAGKADGSERARLIGQFGVGFYSAFIVADRVTVTSRRAGLPADQGVRWTSDGSGEFTVETVEVAKRGTEIVLHLREEAGGESLDGLLSGWKLRDIVRRYSDHVSLPIRMPKERWDAEQSKMVREAEAETVNQAAALWTRPKSELDDAAYRDFWKHLSGDDADPLAWSHARVEGRTEYTQLLYVPATAPYDLWDREHRRGVRLYVRRVFVMDDAEQLLPPYLRFVKGVVDAQDLPLNVSREILQDSRDVKAIREGCTKRVLAMLEDLAENRTEDYATFWTAFGAVLKEGLGEDFANRERLAKLLRFATTATDSPAQSVSLAEYVGRMKPGQDRIYYITAESWQAAKSSPHLEAFRARGVEVLLLSDRVDEWMLSYLREFDGKPLASVARGGIDLDALGKAEGEAGDEKAGADAGLDEAQQALLAALKGALGESVSDVRASTRLVDSAACLVSEEGDISGYLERMLRQAGREVPKRRAVLEVNLKHPLVAGLKADDARLADWAALLHGQALLAEGGQLDDPGAFVRRTNELLLALASR